MDPERCAASLREWFAETGRAPRGYEWSLRVDTLKSLGLATSGRELWEAEYPRWPSAATVAGHLGGWSRALLETGLPVTKQPLDVPLHERVEIARRLVAQGLSHHDVAAELGVHPGTVGTYVRALACTSCGAWVTSRSGPGVLCRSCRNLNRRSEDWPVDQVLEAIREWTGTYGAPPSADGWRRNAGDPRWLTDWPRWPTAAVVVRRVGSCEQALREAGVIDTSRNAMLRRLIEFVDEHGRAPRWSSEINRRTLGASSADYAREFGSWRGALIEAGLPVPPTWDRDSILAAAHDWAANHGGIAPSGHAWSAATAEYPHNRTVLRHFDSWQEMLDEAGLSPAPSWTRERLLAARDAWTLKEGRQPRRDDWARAGDGTPAGTTVYAQFASWAEFLAA